MSHFGSFGIGAAVALLLIFILAGFHNQGAQAACENLTGHQCELKYVPTDN